MIHTTQAFGLVVKNIFVNLLGKQKTFVMIFCQKSCNMIDITEPLFSLFYKSFSYR